MYSKSFAHGTFNGTGAALYVGIGFIPDWVKIWNMEDADCAYVIWSRDAMRVAEHARGTLHYTAAGILGDPLAVGDTGVVLYKGGDIFTSAQTAYLERVKDSELNQCKNSSTGLVIDSWTIDTSGSYTGHWNNECNTTYVGEGSLVMVDGLWYGLHALTSNGEQTDEVTLFGGNKGSYAPTGVINFITPMYDYVGVAAGVITKPGFGLTTTSVSNVSGEICRFEAGTYN